MIYKAQDTKLQRTVALKFLAPHLLTSPEEKTRFLQEAQTAAGLDHPHICTVYEIDEVENQTFIAMAYLEGQSLSERIRVEPLSLEEVAKITIQVADGLKAAHQQGIIHRDIKSSNIIITKENQAKILDFGLAKWSGSTLVTKPGTTTRGTVAYMSPEQAQGASVDQRTDIWSLGVVLYEMLTGQLPFRSEYDQAVIYSILNEEPVSISTLRAGVPGEWGKIVNKCLQKNPDLRYQTIRELQSDLKNVMGQMGLRETLEQFTTTVIKKSPFTSIYSKIFFGITGLFLFLVLLLLFPSSQQTIKRWLGIEKIPLQKHLVVLPFTNIGGDPKNQAFCDGLVETLNSKLSQLEQFQGALRVVPASEVRKFKIFSAEEARKTFGATLAITGSFQAKTDSVRLAVNLVDTKTLRQLRSFVEDYQMANFANMQDQVVRKLAEMLEIELQPQALRKLAKGGTSVSSANVFYLQGVGYLLRYEKPENIDIAIGLFELALKDDSLYSLTYAALGQAYWLKYDATKEPRWIEQAIMNCNRALQLNHELSQAHVTLGLIHAGRGRYKEALKEFQKVLEFDSLNADAYGGLAVAYAGLGQTDKVESIYKKVIELQPGSWNAYNSLGVFYAQQGRYQEAVKQLQQAVVLTPDNIRAYNNLGAVYMYLEKWSEARQMFERSLRIMPNDKAYSNLGTLYFYYEARYSDAARIYEKALELNNRDYRVWGSLASAYYWAPGERAKASATYKRAAQMAEEQLKVNPNNATVLSHLADFYAMLGEFNKAVPLLEKSLTLAPNETEVLARAGETYEELGQREKAIKWLGNALKKGYPLATIERSPGLKELRADTRFQQLTKELPQKQ